MKYPLKPKDSAAALFLLVVALAAAGSVAQAQQPPPNQSSPGNSGQKSAPPAIGLGRSASQNRIVNGIEKFALKCFKLISNAVSNEKTSQDFIISPFSIWSLLALIAEGANGNTLVELKNVLGLPDDVWQTRESYKPIYEALTINASGVELSAAKALFTDQNRPIKPEYEQVINTFYKADIIPVDYYNIRESYEYINNYISQATRGKIQRALHAADLLDAKLILLSAIYFRGMWRSPFNRSQTREDEFMNEFGGSMGRVNMMFQRGAFPYTAIKDLESHILELPYGKDNRLSMIIILPRKSVTLDSVIDRLADYELPRIYDSLRAAAIEYEDDEIEVFLPRFKGMSDFTMNVILDQMGLQSIFDQVSADLSRISQDPLFVSRVIHKSFIEVDEEGTTAAAITGGVIANKATTPRFYANRPFAYLIVEKTSNLILFCGQVRNPDTFRH